MSQSAISFQGHPGVLPEGATDLQVGIALEGAGVPVLVGGDLA